MADNELFGNSEQLDTISRAAALDAPVKMVSEGLEWIPVYHIKALPSAQRIPWDRKTRNSMTGTLQMLRRLVYNIHGVMDVIDDDNVKRLIEWLEGGPDEH